MPLIPLRTILQIRDSFEKNLCSYNLKSIDLDKFTRIYILNDSLILISEIYVDNMPVCINADEVYKDYHDNPYLDFPHKGDVFYKFHVEELTYNELGFKFNNSKFVRNLNETLSINYLELSVAYSKFRGYTRLYWCPEIETTAERINPEMPELKLRERYDNWSGVKYNFLILNCENEDSTINHAVMYTTQPPHTYMVNFGKNFIRSGKGREFFRGWKGVKRQKLLEEHMTYGCIEKYFREKDNAWRYADYLLEESRKGNLDNLEQATYIRPSNKWICEELVLKLTRKLYKDCAVISQYRPFFLKSSKGGQMSYDVFISKLNVAIEYQGKQHFEPVEYFGGENSFKDLQLRDKEKLRISLEQGIKLVYINYWEEITPALIRERVEN